MHRLRTYIAGMGSGGAILGAIALAFVVLGAALATDGLPIGSAESSDAAVQVDSNAPEAAAAAAALAALAPAADAAVPATAAGATPGTTGPGTTAGTVPGGPGESLDPGALPGGPGDGPPTEPPPEPPGQPTGDVAGVVDELDETVQGATGVDLGLGALTEPATGILDTTVKGLNGGKPLGLGDAEVPQLSR